MWDLNSSSATTSGFKALERGNNETHRIKSQDTPSEGDIRFPCEVTGSPHNDAFIRTETQPRQCTENIKIEKGPSYNSMFVDGSTIWVVQCVCREFILVLSTFDTMR